jgi:hypothetical protein
MASRSGHRIERKVVESSVVSPLTPGQVSRSFRRALDEGAKLVSMGSTKRRPGRLLELGYTPKHQLSLYDTTFYFTNSRQNHDIRFVVAYVELGTRGNGPRIIHPRIFYKDMSLIWRSASHYIRSNRENWLGKGDTKVYIEDGEESVYTNEVTTDLPIEIQTGLEAISRTTKRIPFDDDAVPLILRRAPDDRCEPYEDFTGPRRRAERDLGNLLNRGRPIARFTRKNDPTSLRFVRGYEPDFSKGVIERGESFSGLYHGRLQRFRIVSTNREAQYLFIAGPRQVWIGTCQATTTELSSYGLRTVDANVDDDLLLPGYEYHFIDEYEDPPELHTQIPPGFAGEASTRDPYRADTSKWLDAMPVIREFRRTVLGE